MSTTHPDRPGTSADQELDDIRNEVIERLPMLLEQARRGFSAWAEGERQGAYDLYLAIHTLKSNAGIAHIDRLARLTHQMERLLCQHGALQRAVFPAHEADSLGAGLDLIRMCISDVLDCETRDTVPVRG